jgi:hypothetical protein
MAQDPIINEYGVGWTAPAYDAASVTASDSADLAKPTRAIYIGGAGSVKVDTEGGNAVTFQGIASGSLLPIRATRVYSTGTTATNIVALY